jgi:hypothetical protein
MYVLYFKVSKTFYICEQREYIGGSRSTEQAQGEGASACRVVDSVFSANVPAAVPAAAAANGKERDRRPPSYSSQLPSRCFFPALSFVVKFLYHYIVFLWLQFSLVQRFVFSWFGLLGDAVTRSQEQGGSQNKIVRLVHLFIPQKFHRI